MNIGGVIVAITENFIPCASLMPGGKNVVLQIILIVVAVLQIILKAGVQYIVISAKLMVREQGTDIFSDERMMHNLKLNRVPSLLNLVLCRPVFLNPGNFQICGLQLPWLAEEFLEHLPEQMIHRTPWTFRE